MDKKNKKIYKFLEEVSFEKAADEKELAYNDPLVTVEQKKRDRYVTELLNEYVLFYRGKVKHSKICRYIILIPCILIVMGFSVLLVYLSLKMIDIPNTIQIEDLIAFVTACFSFISLIIGLLTIVTKYFFPENDEKYITTIVESIQKNDLNNKRENARYVANDKNKKELSSKR